MFLLLYIIILDTRAKKGKYVVPYHTQHPAYKNCDGVISDTQGTRGDVCDAVKTQDGDGTKPGETKRDLHQSASSVRLEVYRTVLLGPVATTAGRALFLE